MSRYFFHLDDDNFGPDTEGVLLRGFSEARLEAVKSLARHLLDGSSRLDADDELSMTVTDDDGLILFTLTVIGQHSMAMAH